MNQNPFYQTEANWSLSLQSEFKEVGRITSIFSNFTDTISSFEISSEKISVDSQDYDPWMIIAYFDQEPDKEMFESILGLKLELSKIEDKDWVSLIQNNLKPIEAGKFFVHNSKYKKSQEHINIEINPARAFGTGHHETTSMCLSAISEIDITPNTILDLGTGSGILAIGSRKLFKTKVLASDIDEVSISVAKENIELNNDSGNIETILSCGFDNIVPQKFDLIIANILAQVLIDLAKDFSSFTKENSHIILSGILENQEDSVIKAFLEEKFTLSKIYRQNKWICVVMKK